MAATLVPLSDVTELQCRMRYRLHDMPVRFRNLSAMLSPAGDSGTIVTGSTSNVMTTIGVTLPIDRTTLPCGIGETSRKTGRAKTSKKRNNNESASSSSSVQHHHRRDRLPNATVNSHDQKLNILGARGHGDAMLVLQQMTQMLLDTAPDPALSAYSDMRALHNNTNSIQTLTRTYAFVDNSMASSLLDNVPPHNTFPGLIFRPNDPRACSSTLFDAFRSTHRAAERGFATSVYTMQSQALNIVRSGAVPPGVSIVRWKQVEDFLRMLRNLQDTGALPTLEKSTETQDFVAKTARRVWTEHQKHHRDDIIDMLRSREQCPDDDDGAPMHVDEDDDPRSVTGPQTFRLVPVTVVDCVDDDAVARLYTDMMTTTTTTAESIKLVKHVRAMQASLQSLIVDVLAPAAKIPMTARNQLLELAALPVPKTTDARTRAWLTRYAAPPYSEFRESWNVIHECDPETGLSRNPDNNTRLPPVVGKMCTSNVDGKRMTIRNNEMMRALRNTESIILA